jgi:hypothetical protein
MEWDPDYPARQGFCDIRHYHPGNKKDGPEAVLMNRAHP